MAEVLGSHITPERGWPYQQAIRSMIKVTLDNTEGIHIKHVGMDKPFEAPNKDMAHIANIARQIAIAATKAGQPNASRKIQSLVQRMMNCVYELPTGDQFQPRTVEVDGYKYSNI